MADESDTPPKPAYLENLNCQEVYAETVQVLFGTAPGMLRVELCVHRWTTQPPIHADRIVPVARFALSFELAKILRDQLTSTLERAAKQGSTLANMPAASSAKN